MSDSKSRIICNFNDNRRFCKLTKRTDFPHCSVESESFDDSLWENIKINCGKENIILVHAKFSDGSVIEDNAVWTGV